MLLVKDALFDLEFQTNLDPIPLILCFSSFLLSSSGSSLMRLDPPGQTWKSSSASQQETQRQDKNIKKSITLLKIK